VSDMIEKKNFAQQY